MPADPNPYRASGLEHSPADRADTLTTQLRWLLAILIGYYVFSCVTLPLANRFWLGELPLFAIPQLPKIWLYNLIRGKLIVLTCLVGWGRGSASLDLMAMTPWSFALLFLSPSTIAITLTAACRRLKKCWPWIWRLIAIASLDALVTTWFYQTSRLSMF